MLSLKEYLESSLQIPKRKKIMSYTPPFEITSKILNLVSEISEAIGKLEVLTLSSKNLKLRKANKIKTITGTLSIEGNTLSEEKVTAILNGKRVVAKKKR